MKLFYKVSRYLKKAVDLPIKIRRIKMKELCGSCEKKNKFFLVKVDSSLDEEHAISILIHEISHCVAWNKDKDWHGRNWGLAYSKIYRIFAEEFLK